MSEQVRPHIGGNVRYYRMVRGLTIQQLAQKSGVGRTALCVLEAGQCSPRLSTVIAICKALDIPLEWMCSIKRPEVPNGRFESKEEWLE